jgi:hypothetical protein
MGEDTTELAVYTVIESEGVPALRVMSRVDEAAVTQAGQVFLDIVGDAAAELVGGTITVLGHDLDGGHRGMVSTKSSWPEDFKSDPAVVELAVRALVTTLIKVLVPTAKIESAQSTRDEYLN